LPPGLPDPATLARMASELFAALPGDASSSAGARSASGVPGTPPAGISALPAFTPGVQVPTNFAPAGSPLVSPAGIGPGVPGTPIPQGLVPGVNLLPASPTHLPHLANRAPALLPHAQAGNGLPDSAVTIAPALDSRFGGAALGVPQATGTSAHQAASHPATGAAPFYFLNGTYGHPSAGGRGSDSAALPPQVPVSGIGNAPGLDGYGLQEPTDVDALARLAQQPAPVSPTAQDLPVYAPQTLTAYTPPAGGAPSHSTPSAADLPHATSVPSAPPEPAVPQSTPAFYFVDAVRLPSGYTTPAKADPLGTRVQRVEPLGATPQADHAAHPPFDVNAIRRDFPILRERVNGKPLVWFDNAATTHKPQSVIDRISYFYEHENSNIHRAAHELAARATDAYEGARERVKKFINAPDVNEVIFVRGTTEAINLVAKSWGGQHIGAGDEIIVSNLEHHANIVPWQQLAAAKGAKIRVIPVDDSGQVLLDEYKKLLNDRTKIVSVTQVSNALGTVVPVKQIVELAHRAGAKALVDGAQSISHMRVDVQDIGADFFVFSGHKVFGPTGIGVVWGKREVLEDMPPWQGGGNMIADVTFEKTVYQPIPNKFEAGTGNIADAVGLGAAIDYVNRVGIENIARYEHELLVYGMAQLRTIPGVRLIGTADDKASVMSFVLAGYTTEEVGQALNDEGIAVRTGHHCAQPILRRFGVETTVRPSLAFYNTFEEIDRLIAVVRRLASVRRTG
jgi:cysteine desulfurase/selenocysteine lyase